MKLMLRNTVLLILTVCILMSTVTMSGCMLTIKAEEISADHVPNDALIREFIGGGIFRH